jgi:hypothetical protein
MTTRNEANNTLDVADQSNPFGADLWLHIATDCLRRYAREFTVAIVAQSDGLVIALPGINAADPRLHQGFLALIPPLCAPVEAAALASDPAQLPLFALSDELPLVTAVGAGVELSVPAATTSVSPATGEPGARNG